VYPRVNVALLANDPTNTAASRFSISLWTLRLLVMPTNEPINMILKNYHGVRCSMGHGEDMDCRRSLDRYLMMSLLPSSAHSEAPASTSKPATFGGWCNAIGTTRPRHLILIIPKRWSYINPGFGTANIRASMMINQHLLWLTGIGQHPLV